MAEVKSFRLRNDLANWLANEAFRANVSMNRIVEELLDRAAREGWQFGIKEAPGARP